MSCPLDPSSTRSIAQMSETGLVKESRTDKQRCQDAESKIDLIAEWINEVTNNSESTTEGTEVNLPPLMIDDFSPALGSSSQMPNTNTNTILSSGISQLNLAKLSHLKGTLTMGRKGLGLGSMGGSGMGMGMGMGRMLREESQFDLAGAGDDSF
jgi:hypothetical protein